MFKGPSKLLMQGRLNFVEKGKADEEHLCGLGARSGYGDSRPSSSDSTEKAHFSLKRRCAQQLPSCTSDIPAV